MIFYAGDIHGRVKYVAEIDQAAAAAGVDVVIQVGDFGARWGTRETELASGLVGKGDDPILKYFEKRERQGRPGPIWYTCGGNHENWHNWIKPGYNKLNQVLNAHQGIVLLLMLIVIYIK